MSSWDRTRSIPWSRAASPLHDSSSAQDSSWSREQVLRDLEREAARQEREESTHNEASSMAASTALPDSSDSSTISTINSGTLELNFLGYRGRPYQTSDLLRNLAFGGTIGSITGLCFGFMDSIRSASSSQVLKSASHSAQAKYVFQGSYRSGLFFGGFFAMFHGVKYAMRVCVDPGDVGEIGVGSLITLGGIMTRKEWRGSFPYALMLLGMDGFHVMMRDDGKGR